MSAPHPAVISKALGHLADVAGPLATEYQWMYPSATTRTRRESAGGSTTHEDGSPSNLSDTLASTAAARSNITQAGVAILEAVSQLHRAQVHLSNIQVSIDSRAPLAPEQHERAIAHPADRGDVRRAKQAQSRRNLRMVKRTLPWSAEEVMG